MDEKWNMIWAYSAENRNELKMHNKYWNNLQERDAKEN